MLGIQLMGNAPIYEQVVRQIEEQIAKGILQKDDLLPSVREMACDLAVNPNTIQKVYGILEERGITYSVPGKGRFVAIDETTLREKKSADDLENLKVILEKLRQNNVSLETVMLTARQIYNEGGETVS